MEYDSGFTVIFVSILLLASLADVYCDIIFEFQHHIHWKWKLSLTATFKMITRVVCDFCQLCSPFHHLKLHLETFSTGSSCLNSLTFFHLVSLIHLFPSHWLQGKGKKKQLSLDGALGCLIYIKHILSIGLGGGHTLASE